MAAFTGGVLGYWFSGWSLRTKNRKLKEKYDREYKVRHGGGTNGRGAHGTAFQSICRRGLQLWGILQLFGAGGGG